MTRFLFATMPAAGHVGPLVPVASELVARGHSVAWYTGARAAAMQAEMARYKGADRAAELLEQLAVTRAPVLVEAARVAVPA